MKKIITLLSVAAIVFDIFTPLRLYFEGGKALMMLMPTVVILLNDRLFVKKTFLPIGLYVATCLLLMVMGSEYFSIPQLINYLFAYACFEHFIVTRDQQFAKVVLSSVYITLMVMVAISIPLFISMPNLSRLMLEAEENGVTESIMFWTIQYQTIHSLPVYSIPLCYLAKTANSHILRFISILSALAVFILMFFADATTALLLTIGIYGALLLYNTRKTVKHNIIKLGIAVIVLLIFLNKTILIGVLRASQFIFVGSSTYKKIDEMVLSLSGQVVSGDIESREDLLNKSLNSFWTNPLFPEMNMNNIGQHNFLIDQIVAMGLIPGISFILFLVERIKRPAIYMSTQTKPFYWLCVIVLLVMGLSKNFFLIFPTCCVAPMMFIFFDNKEVIRK